MALVIRVGYEQYAISETALEAVKNMCRVTEKVVDRITKYYIEEEGQEVEIRVISDVNIVDPNDSYAVRRDAVKMLAEQEKVSETRFQWYLDEKKKKEDLEVELRLLKEKIEKEGEANAIS